MDENKTFQSTGFFGIERLTDGSTVRLKFAGVGGWAAVDIPATKLQKAIPGLVQAAAEPDEDGDRAITIAEIRPMAKTQTGDFVLTVIDPAGATLMCNFDRHLAEGLYEALTEYLQLNFDRPH